MKNEKVRRILISTIQALCILCGYVWARLYLIAPSTPWWLYYFFPIFVSFILSFLLSIFFSVQVEIKSRVGISVPATLMYLVLFAVEPLAFRYDTFLLVGICGFVLPITLAGFAANTLAICLGSLVHVKVFRENISSSTNV